MSGMPAPFPEQLCPRRGRAVLWGRPLLLGTLVASLLALPALWRVREIKDDGCPGAPPAAHAALAGLVGTPLIALDLNWARRQLDQWPAVAAADVHLRLPATLEVSTRRASPVASVMVGRSWHGIARDGSLAGPLEAPARPIVAGVAHRNGELRRALAVARRVANGSGAEVLAVRRVMPDDFELVLASACVRSQQWTVHVAATSTAAESRWCELVRSCRLEASWADLRLPGRIVVGGER